MFSFWTGKVMTGRVWISGLHNSPLSGRGRLFSFISTQCLYYVLSSLILTFCKYFWISLLTVWRMRRIRSHLILSETMQISPRLPQPKSHQISLSRRTWESQLCGLSLHLTAHLLLSLSEIYAGHISGVRAPGADTLTLVPCVLVTGAGHWVAAKMG